MDKKTPQKHFKADYLSKEAQWLKDILPTPSDQLRKIEKSLTDVIEDRRQPT